MAGVPNSHQTIRLSRGRHSSPADGACVMELSSMLAGERFTDNPRCVDPVVAAYLRALNDRLDHVERQRLLPYASLAVGTRGHRAARRERLRACLEFAGVRSHLGARLRFAVFMGVPWLLRLEKGAGEYAARRAIADDRVEDAFRLLDRLLGHDQRDATPARSAPAGEAAALVGAPAG